MAAPKDPGGPNGLDPEDDADRGGGWVRPSERRPARDPEPPAAASDHEPGSDHDETDDAPRPRPARARIRRPDPPEPDTADETPAAEDDEATTALEPTAGLRDDENAGDEPAPTVAAAAGVPVAAAAGRSARRARQHRNRRRAVAGIAAALVMALVVGAVLLTSGGGSTRALTKHVKLIPTTTTKPTVAPVIIATDKVLVLQAFDQPAPTAKVVTTLPPKTSYGLPTTMLVTAEQPGYYQVLLPMRPNDTKAWIRQSDATVSTTDYAIRVNLSAHHLWLTKAGTPVLDTAVVIGNAKTPTPTGLFYVTDPVDLRTQPNGAYGAFALGLSGYSNVLTEFEGGPGQIAVHGTPYADQVGQDLSNGCVRVPNPIITQIAGVVPLGTPVNITA